MDVDDDECKNEDLDQDLEGLLEHHKRELKLRRMRVQDLMQQHERLASELDMEQVTRANQLDNEIQQADSMHQALEATAREYVSLL